MKTVKIHIKYYINIEYYLYPRVYFELGFYILKIPNFVSGIGAFSEALRDRPRTLKQNGVFKEGIILWRFPNDNLQR